MKPIIIFGTGKIAEVLLYFFQTASDRKVVACTVDKAYLPGESWNELPCIPFEEIQRTHPPSTHDMFVALGYQDMNRLRAAKTADAITKGYELPSYVHPNSGIPSDCQFGYNCFIMNQVLIHPRVRLGNNVYVWSGAMIGHHSQIGDNCWLTSCCNISGNVTTGNNCFFAVNSTVGHSVQIGADCFLGANALVTKCAGDEQVFLHESTSPCRLNSRQFLRMSNFSNI